MLWIPSSACKDTEENMLWIPSSACKDTVENMLWIPSSACKVCAWKPVQWLELKGSSGFKVEWISVF